MVKHILLSSIYFFFFVDVIDIEHYISFRCIAWWFDICMYSWNDHHNKSIYYVSLYRVITFTYKNFNIFCLSNFKIGLILLTIIPMLYNTSPWLIYLYLEVCTTWSLCPISPTPRPLLLWETTICSLYL